ncbi:hypothetical protein E2C01_092805 [Portunus trituberculatus]|uniref:Uncharacterized protein n=1 Tax=Portunus trituberculatus TaxID=210409 RepID=A0A5B7JWF0_PORTR|nr:hypothetical protein [Portunus trituberculatus]
MPLPPLPIPPPPPPPRISPPRLQDIDTCINLTTLLAWTLLAVTLWGTFLPLALSCAKLATSVTDRPRIRMG